MQTRARIKTLLLAATAIIAISLAIVVGVRTTQSAAGADAVQPAARAAETDVAAHVIGISRSELAAQLAAGTSISSVARSHGIDPQAVSAALVARAQSQLAAAVASHRLTEAQADPRRVTLALRIASLMTAT